MVDKQEFNKEIDDYISTIRHRGSSEWQESVRQPTISPSIAQISSSLNQPRGGIQPKKRRLFFAGKEEVKPMSSMQKEAQWSNADEFQEEFDQMQKIKYANQDAGSQRSRESESSRYAATEVYEDQSLFEKFMAMFRREAPAKEEYEEVSHAQELQSESVDAQGLREDMKELAVVMTAIMRRFPPEQVQDLKDSHEFLRFKTIMRKHKVIK